MRKPWFDPDTGVLLLDDLAMDMPSIRNVLSDGIVTEEEIAGHAERVVSILKGLEKKLTPELHEDVTEALCELAVLYILQSKRIEQER